jgi:hypothetical protein
MATPLPTDGDVDRSVPHGEEAVLIVRRLAAAPCPAGRGSAPEDPNRHHVPRASEAGAMTAKPCDPTATAQEEGR